MTAPPSAEYFNTKAAEGWRLVAVEWERGAQPHGVPIDEVPFGLRVASDCKRLEEDPGELEVLGPDDGDHRPGRAAFPGSKTINNAVFARATARSGPQSSVLPVAEADRDRAAPLHQRRMGGAPQTHLQRGLNVGWATRPASRESSRLSSLFARSPGKAEMTPARRPGGPPHELFLLRLLFLRSVRIRRRAGLALPGDHANRRTSPAPRWPLRNPASSRSRA